MNTIDTMHQFKVSLWHLSYTHWKTSVLFSIQWWSLFILAVAAYIIWWRFVDKHRLSEILLFGSFIAVGRMIMDLIGTNMVLWSYDISLTPFIPSPFIHDITDTPLVLMLVYQYCSSWRTFLIWTSIVTGIITFIFFPVSIAVNILTYFHWNHVYSFLLIILIASLSRAVLLGILHLEQRCQTKK
ncbi:Hypothetical protein LUCI_0483 [Lucifera butyrica]|uniref:Uncharacterized protein n=1 Tax=Lucifera butyrica TaxID=1351585 RepID=A0A498QYL7_9FIRM|nr:CBO0543 family protein [Lucifera butyrica]VBB05276.1 Hypothetical protein LUCI_0483 [Lucifera butyrica]